MSFLQSIALTSNTATVDQNQGGLGGWVRPVQRRVDDFGDLLVLADRSGRSRSPVDCGRILPAHRRWSLARTAETVSLLVIFQLKGVKCQSGQAALRSRRRWLSWQDWRSEKSGDRRTRKHDAPMASERFYGIYSYANLVEWGGKFISWTATLLDVHALEPPQGVCISGY